MGWIRLVGVRDAVVRLWGWLWGCSLHIRVLCLLARCEGFSLNFDNRLNGSQRLYFSVYECCRSLGKVCG